jgi:hypothetical protein
MKRRYFSSWQRLSMTGVFGRVEKIAHEQRWVDMQLFKQGIKEASER